MAGLAGYETQDALELADLVRRGEVTPAERLDAGFKRIATRNHPSAMPIAP